MRVNFYATLRAIAGGKTVEVDLPASTPAWTVLEAVTSTRAELDAEIWLAPRQLKEHIKVFINGRQSLFLPLQLETPLAPDDVLDIFPPVGGGSWIVGVESRNVVPVAL